MTSLPARPDVSPIGVVLAVLYASVVAGALSVGVGATALAASHGGVHAGFVVGGVFVFVVGFVGIRVVDVVGTGAIR